MMSGRCRRDTVHLTRVRFPLEIWTPWHLPLPGLPVTDFNPAWCTLKMTLSETQLHGSVSHWLGRGQRFPDDTRHLDSETCGNHKAHSTVLKTLVNSLSIPSLSWEKAQELSYSCFCVSGYMRICYQMQCFYCRWVQLALSLGVVTCMVVSSKTQ